MASPRARVLTRSTLFVAILATLLIAGTGPAAAGQTETDRIVSVAKAQLGDPWVWAAKGPHQFDCVGLVYYVFKRTGLLKRIGGKFRLIRGYWDWFADRGRASRSNGRRGDLVIWGRGKHIGIYLGKGRAISTTTRGVRIHGLHTVNLPFSTFLHVRLQRG
jgi:cell wall-associated NlpC family hydrolase